MGFRTIVSFSLFAISMGLLQCNPLPTVATLDATITPRDDEVGNQSTYAYINFTEFQSSMVQGNLQLTFLASDPEGQDNEMVLVLQNSGGSFPQKTYIIDGSSKNSFRASIVVRRNLTPEVISVTSTEGFINLEAIEVDSNNILKGVQGGFKVNFSGGGVGEGTFRATR